jgi:hypothetical protein
MVNFRMSLFTYQPLTHISLSTQNLGGPRGRLTMMCCNLTFADPLLPCVLDLVAPAISKSITYPSRLQYCHIVSSDGIDHPIWAAHNRATQLTFVRASKSHLLLCYRSLILASIEVRSRLTSECSRWPRNTVCGTVIIRLLPRTFIFASSRSLHR